MKILLVSSTGGHFNALQKLSIFWGQYDCCWVTFRTATTETALKNKNVYWAYSPTNRNLPNLIRNFILAFQVILQERPELILTTGAGVAVPFLIVGKLFGAKTAFVESFTRIEQLSLSARLAMPFLDVVYVHWQQLKERYTKAELIMPNPL
jgi:beta-1,4-N-acetylglucosaminyltransferase